MVLYVLQLSMKEYHFMQIFNIELVTTRLFDMTMNVKSLKILGVNVYSPGLCDERIDFPCR